MVARVIALLLAILAIATRPYPLPADFTAGLARAHEVAEPGFVGLAWTCSPPDTETCWAGLVITAADGAYLETGP
jgi:hypothetical protein